MTSAITGNFATAHAQVFLIVNDQLPDVKLFLKGTDKPIFSYKSNYLVCKKRRERHLLYRQKPQTLFIYYYYL